MSLRRRIWSLPIITIVLLGVSLSINTYFSLSAIESIAKTEKIDAPFMELAKRLSTEVQEVSEGLREAVAEGDKKRVDTLDVQALKVRNSYKKLAILPDMADIANQQQRLFDTYYVAAQKSAVLMLGIEEGDPAEAIDTMQAAYVALEADLQTLNDTAATQFQDGIHYSDYSVHNLLIANTAVGILIVLISITMSYFVVRNIWAQLGGEPSYVREIANQVAHGNLATNIKLHRRDQDSLLYSMTLMKDKLRKTVGNIREGANTIAAATNSIASGNADLSKRTEEQANALERTASEMEKLTSTVHQNADSAQQANKMANGASEVAIKGGEVVGQVVETMVSINNSSKKIVEIITVIDGIAFQTNILALNAAVEAARAGEQGRGFAVVASEVRNLAQRSAAAAKEITELINDSVREVEAGSSLVERAGSTMNEVVDSVKHVTNIVSEISLASREQSVGIDQVNQVIARMDETTKHNAALVEEATAAAQELKEQAANLAESVGVFVLSEEDERNIQLHQQSILDAAEAHEEAPLQLASTATSTPSDWEDDADEADDNTPRNPRS
jgi:methyl-accepting chemotaxis protein